MRQFIVQFENKIKKVYDIGLPDTSSETEKYECKTLRREYLENPVNL